MNNTLETLIARLLQELEGSLRSVDADAVHALVQHMLKAKRIFVVGKGRSGLHMRAFAMRLMHLGLSVYVVDDVTTPAIGVGDFLLVGSGSGRTPSLVHYARRARTLQAGVGLITIDPLSPIAEQAECIVCIHAPTPKLEDANQPQSMLPMGSLFEQTLGLLLEIVIVQMMAELHITAEQMFTRHANLE